MILVRLTHGITDHFPIRKAEWVMAYMASAMTLVLVNQDDMFSTSPSYTKLAQIADESTWAGFLVVYACMRLVALIVNGTFSNFRHSPLLRFIASGAGIFFWSQYCLGFLSSAIYSGGAWSPVAAYSTAVVLELLNVHQSLSDMIEGYAKRKEKANGLASSDRTGR